jgi:hypothetical protein
LKQVVDWALSPLAKELFRLLGIVGLDPPIVNGSYSLDMLFDSEDNQPDSYAKIHPPNAETGYSWVSHLET